MLRNMANDEIRIFFTFASISSLRVATLIGTRINVILHGYNGTLLLLSDKRNSN